jgi:hypothetical protein
MKNGQTRATGNIGYTRRRKTKQYKYNTVCIEQDYARIDTINVKKTNNWWKRRTEHHFYADIVTDITIRNSEGKDT